MRLHRDRAHARPAAAVRNAERLVQVQVRHVGAEVPGRRKARPARSGWRRRRTPGRRARARCRRFARCPASNTPCVDGYVTMIAASSLACASALRRRSARSTLPPASQATTTTRMPGHLRRRRIGAVRRRRNQAHVAMRLAARAVPGARSSAGRRTRPASPRWAAAIRRRIRSPRTASARGRRSVGDSPPPAPPARTDAARRTPAT